MDEHAAFFSFLFEVKLLKSQLDSVIGCHMLFCNPALKRLLLSLLFSVCTRKYSKDRSKWNVYFYCSSLISGTYSNFLCSKDQRFGSK